MKDICIHDEKIKFVEEKANDIRQTVINMLIAAGSGHTAGALGMADIFATFYFHVLNQDPKNPDWPDRDRLILSNGHVAPVRYAAMAHAGYFPVEECLTLRKFGSRLQGHPERNWLPGVESSSGPLGEGLGQAAGIAYAAKMDGNKFQTYCFMGDGELDAGDIWESLMFAGKYKLNNLTGLVDRNNIQIDGMTENVMPLEPLKDKFEAFNWHVLEIDGHNIQQIAEAANEAKTIYEKPTMIIAHTIPGKGIPDIEFDYRYHGISPKPEDVQKFIDTLRTLGGKIHSEHE
jgi:transketolase